MKLLLAAVAALALCACPKNNTPAVSPAAQAAGVGLDPNTVVATYGDNKKVTLGELDISIAKDLFDLRHKALETMVIRSLIQADAAKAGKDEETYLKELSEKLVPEVTDDEMRPIYEANKEAMGGRSFEEIKPMIAGRMRQQKERQAMMGYFEKMKQQNNVKISLPEPRITVAAVGPAKGPEGAPVTIVEFSDFQCPYCKQAKATADQVFTNFAGKVRLVFRDYPLPFHDKAKKAAEAGHCAEEQGKFWEMHDWMFDHQDKLDVPSLMEGAKGLGLDPQRFDPCLDGGKYAAKVAENTKAGEEAGVTGTPAFFINGKLLSGAEPYEKFKELVEAELK
jgi:protein-disulfide isomerase